MENERLISAPKLVIDLAKQYHGDNGLFCYDKLMATIADAPTVDAVEVVRCKDCKHWKAIGVLEQHWECQIFCGLHDYGYLTGADDFCSYGERREGE